MSVATWLYRAGLTSAGAAVGWSGAHELGVGQVVGAIAAVAIAAVMMRVSMGGVDERVEIAGGR